MKEPTRATSHSDPGEKVDISRLGISSVCAFFSRVMDFLPGNLLG